MRNTVTLLDRPLAIVDLETTGLDPAYHEILEIGLIVVHHRTLVEQTRLDVKVLPEHPERIDAIAIARNGYNAADWEHAMSLSTALFQFSNLMRGAVLAGHNIGMFDERFLKAAYARVGLRPSYDYHSVDSFSAAWPAVVANGLTDAHLNTICRMLGVPEEPMPHRAINGAEAALAVLRRMTDVVRAGLATVRNSA